MSNMKAYFISSQPLAIGKVIHRCAYFQYNKRITQEKAHKRALRDVETRSDEQEVYFTHAEVTQQGGVFTPIHIFSSDKMRGCRDEKALREEEELKKKEAYLRQAHTLCYPFIAKGVLYSLGEPYKETFDFLGGTEFAVFVDVIINENIALSLQVDGEMLSEEWEVESYIKEQL